MQTKQQLREEESLVFGLRPIIEAINAGKQLDKLFIQSGLRGELFNTLKGLLKQHDIPFQYVPVEKLNRLTKSNHQGVIGTLSSITYKKIRDIVPALIAANKKPLLLILDRITDVRNFGAISRTAECAGVDAIIIPSSGAAQINADALKTSAGALHKIAVCKEDNLKQVIEFLKQQGVKVIACTEKADSNYFQMDFTESCAIIMGSEENGVSNTYLQMADEKAKIPMMGKISSLNVSVANGIILYEAVSQRILVNS